MAVDTNDFEIALGVVFDKAAEQQAIAEFLGAAKKIEKEGENSTKRQIADAQKASARRLADQLTANRKWSEAERKQYAAIKSAAEAFFRASAQARREASQTERREFERQSKQQLQDRRAANQRLQAIVDAGLKDAADRRRSAQRMAEQDNASGLRRFEAQEREAARNLERLAKEQARTSERIAKERAAEAARLDKQRLAESTAAAKEQAAVARREGEKLAQQQKQTDRLLFNAEQESSARRIARAKAFYSTLASVTRSGAQATQNVVTSFFRRRENAARQVGDRISNIDRSTTNRSTSVIRQQLETQNSVYSRAAERRLRIIESAGASERKVISANAVKNAEIQAQAQAKLNSGVLGAAGAGRTGIGAGGILSILGGGLAGRRIYETLADFQTIQTAFRGLFDEVEGRAPKTTAFLAEMQRFAKQTPFSLRDLATYAQKFFANGLVDPKAADAVDKLESKLMALANAASATGKSQDQVQGAILGLTQISASGRLSLEDLRQVTEGIGLRLSDVAAKLGLTTGELFDQLSKGKIGAEEGLKAIFEGLNEIPGAAGAAARQAKTLRGAMSNLGDVLDQFILRTLGPLGERLAVVISGFADFAGKLLDGQGVYKLVRDGLLGISLALGAIIAAKGAVQVIGLLNIGLKLLAANPGIVAIAALAAGAAILYRNTPGVRDFFGALVEGTKNWYLVGYRISEPIKNLSKIVLLQSSFGAAARVIVDGIKGIGRGVEDFRSGLGTGALEEALRTTLAGLGDVLAPAKDVVADGLRVIFERGRDFLTQRALPILGEARLNVGSFLLPLLGLTGGSGGVVSRVVTSAITKLFLGSIASFNPDIPAAQLGTRTREIIDGAIAYAQGSARNVKTFFASLFGGDIEVGNFSSELGGQLNEIISGAFGRLKERVGPVKDLMASIGSAVATGFTTYVLPKLIELPRIVGRFLSRTVFSEEFLKAVTVTAAAVAGVAIVVAGQFVRGFVEGLISRRGDIAKTVTDILSFVAKTVIGSGDPLVLIGGALVAAFAGAKVLGAIGTLRGQFRIAAAGMTGDAKKLQKAVADAAQAKTPASTSKVGNAALAISNGYRKAEVFVTRVGKGIENAGAKTVALGGFIDTVGNRLLKLPLDANINNAGRLVSSSTGRFVKDTTADLNGLQRRAGEFANKYAGLLSTPLIKGGAAIQAFPRLVQSSLQRATGWVKSFASSISDTIPNDVSRAQLAVQVGASAMTGYFAGLAETTQAKAVGVLASVGEVAGAFAVGGPVVGGIAAVATAVTFFWGESTGAARRAKEQQRKAAEEVAKSAESIRKSYSEAFKELGSTGSAARGVATLRVVQDQINGNSKGVEDFTRKFGGSWSAVTDAARRGNAELKAYTDEIISSKIRDIFAGNADAIKTFRTEAEKAAVAAITAGDTTFSRLKLTGQLTQDQIDGIRTLNGELRSGRIGWDEYARGLSNAGVAWEDIATLTKVYTDALQQGLGSSAGGKVIANLSSEMGKAVREQELMTAAQVRVNRELASTASVADRFKDAWGRVKEQIDRTREAFEGWIDATQGGRQTRNESITSILGAARQATQPAGDGVSELERTAEIENLAIEQARNAGAQLSQIWKDSGGNVDTFNARARAYFDELRAAAPTKEAQDFISQVQYLSTSPQQINLIVNSAPPIKSLEDIQTKLTDLISLPGNEKYAIDISTTEGTKRAETLGSKLAELYNTDATVKAYIDTEVPGGFAEAYKRIVEDTGFIDQITTTAKADLDPTGFNEKKKLITTGLDELERRDTKLHITPTLNDPTGGWAKLFGFMGINLSINGGPSGSVPTGGNWSDYGGGSSSRTGPQQTVPPTRGERGRPRNLTSSGRRSGPGPVRPDGESGGMIGYQGARNRGKNPGIPPMNGGDAPTPWPFIPNKEGSWSNNLPWEFLRAFYDAFKPKETFWRIGQVLAFNTEKLGIDLGRNLGNAITLTGERLGGKTRSTGLDVTLGAWRSVQRAIIPTAEGPVGGPQNLVNSQGFRFEGVGRAAVKALGNEAPFRLGDDATGVAAQAADLIERVKAKILNFLRLSRAAIDRPFDIIDWDLGRVLEEVLTSAATRIRNVVWRGGDAILADARAAIEAALPSSSAPTPNGSTGGRRNLTSGGDLLIPFFATGGITAYAAGGITQAHVQRHQRIKYAEPETGGEAYIPRLGNRLRSMAVLQQAASWFGGRFVRGGTVGMAAGGVMAGESLYASGLMSPTEAAAERRLSAHIAEVLALIDRIMARVSKSMTLAEARAAVLEATAAHHQLGAAEGAQWDAALTRFFAGSTVPMSSGPSLPSPSRPGSSPTANIDFTKPQVVIHRNLTVEANIAATQPVPTALEVVRRARDSDFLAGGPALEMEYVG